MSGLTWALVWPDLLQPEQGFAPAPLQQPLQPLLLSGGHSRGSPNPPEPHGKAAASSCGDNHRAGAAGLSQLLSRLRLSFRGDNPREVCCFIVNTQTVPPVRRRNGTGLS